MKEKNKILIIGDLHLKEILGYADYIQDRREKEKKEIFDFIVKQSLNCSRVIFLGDSFNSKNNTSLVIKQFISLLERFDGKEIFILSGNHETFGDGKTAIDFLKEISNKNWHIITNEIVKINNYIFCPYFHRAQLEAKDNQEATDKLLNQLIEGDVLFIHHAISDTKTSSGALTDLFDEIVLPYDILQKKYKLIVGGHVHNPNYNKQILVAGSIFNNEIGETAKYIWKMDEQNFNVEMIDLPGRPIYKLENPLLEDFKGLNRKGIVKVILSDEKFKNKLEEIKKEAKKFDAYLFLEQYPHERKKLHFEEGMIEFNIEKLLEIYSKEKNIDLKKLQKAYDLIVCDSQ